MSVTLNTDETFTYRCDLQCGAAVVLSFDQVDEGIYLPEGWLTTEGRWDTHHYCPSCRSRQIAHALGSEGVGR